MITKEGHGYPLYRNALRGMKALLSPALGCLNDAKYGPIAKFGVEPVVKLKGLLEEKQLTMDTINSLLQD